MEIFYNSYDQFFSSPHFYLLTYGILQFHHSNCRFIEEHGIAIGATTKSAAFFNRNPECLCPSRIHVKSIKFNSFLTLSFPMNATPTAMLAYQVAIHPRCIYYARDISQLIKEDLHIVFDLPLGCETDDIVLVEAEIFLLYQFHLLIHNENRYDKYNRQRKLENNEPLPENSMSSSKIN